MANNTVTPLPLIWGVTHRRIQDFVRGAKALLAPLDPRLTIWGSNFCGEGGGGGPLDPRLSPPPPFLSLTWQRGHNYRWEFF